MAGIANTMTVCIAWLRKVGVTRSSSIGEAAPAEEPPLLVEQPCDEVKPGLAERLLGFPVND